MLISLNWIKDFVSVPPQLAARELAERLTLATAEVEEVVEAGAVWPLVEVVRVTHKEPHPNADTLWLVDFEMEGGKFHRVVCGAPNVEIGMKAAFVPVGAKLPTGLTLEAKKIRGVESAGMLCSEYELGLSDEAEGIIHLHPDAPVGQPFDQYMQQHQGQSGDVIFHIDNKSLTHRPDLWGHYGMARELAAILQVPLANPYNNDWQKKLSADQGQATTPIAVKVDKDSACTGFFGLSVSGVKIGPSPTWMQARLRAVGLKAINNIVDISNFVMLELGHPLHIYDRARIAGDRVQVRLAKSGETLTTLDEIERQLDPSDTVIADADKALVLAGVMGGLNSGVSDNTQNLFIEVANWEPARVRATSTRLGLRTEACQRFEKGLDSPSMERVLWRTWELTLQICPEARVTGQLQYDGPDLATTAAPHIPLKWTELRRVLGVPVEESRVVDILQRLDFSVERRPEGLSVGVPSYRATRDIEGPADLIEEVGRMIGYGNIPATAPRLEVRPARLTPAQVLHRKLRDCLAMQAGAFEVHTYPLVGGQLLKRATWPQDNAELTLLNPPSREWDRMRPSLVPSLLKAVALNAKREEAFRCFEIGRAYAFNAKDFRRETSQLAVAFYSSEASPFMDLANAFDRLMRACQFPVEWVERDAPFPNEAMDTRWPGLHPFEFYHLRLMGKLKGALFSLHPRLSRQFKLKGHLAVGVLNLDSAEKVTPKNKVRYQAPAKFPGTHFDCTVEVERYTPVAKVLAALKSLKMKERVSSSVADIFAPEGEKLKYITLRHHLQDKAQTLSSEALKRAEDSITAHLEKAGFPLKAGG